MNDMSELEQKTRTRLRELLVLQKQLAELYGEDDYNVFVFGSYTTTAYEEGRSDVDIAVYTEDFELYKQISLYLEQWFAQKQIPSDIFYIDTTLPAPIYLAPLQSPIQFTDFFPDKLKIYWTVMQIMAKSSGMKQVAIFNKKSFVYSHQSVR